jgi:hypothetical protein
MPRPFRALAAGVALFLVTLAPPPRPWRRPGPGPADRRAGGRVRHHPDGANDLCGWGGALTPTSTFRAQSGRPWRSCGRGCRAATCSWPRSPNLYQLWSILRTHPLAQVVWQTADSCPSMLDFLQLARRPPGRHRPPARAQRRPPRRLRHLVALPLRQRPDLRLRLHPRPGLRLDFFHPSLRGQAALAALTWEASWWG